MLLLCEGYYFFTCVKKDNCRVPGLSSVSPSDTAQYLVECHPTTLSRDRYNICQKAASYMMNIDLEAKSHLKLSSVFLLHFILGTGYGYCILQFDLLPSLCPTFLAFFFFFKTQFKHIIQHPPSKKDWAKILLKASTSSLNHVRRGW